mmetsp:Transcript_26537/g.69814  ORF Transcript_26537/g.69814 Transcript_26537/m.69814 type:complete len:214 (+) Transcript_26537:282-923(+)
MDWTPNQTGMLRPDHVVRYAELGSWLSGCYGSSTATVSNASVDPSSPTVSLSVPADAVIDRVVLREDLTNGQRVLGFSISVSGAASNPVIQGQSIGNRFIGLLPSAVTGPATITVNVTSAVAATLIREMSVYNCTRTPQNGGCSFVNDFAYKIVPSITVTAEQEPTVTACCALCHQHAECAVFVFDASGLCTVMSANQGGEPKAGAISGSPNH